MARLHLFEFEDQAWFPELIRDAGTAYLVFAARIARHGEGVAPVLARTLNRSGQDRIVDLCSGGSGPLPGVVEALGGELERPLRSILLTDLYPNQKAFEDISAEHALIDYVHDSVNALNVPEELSGLRTLFNGFHHFRPDAARQILRNAVEDSASIAIFEFGARRPTAILAMLIAPFMVMLALPFLRPFRWGWLPWTYLIPVIPLFVFWDGVVSCLRCYSEQELRELVEAVGATNFEWEVGSIAFPGAPFPGTYLIGVPVREVVGTGGC